MSDLTVEQLRELASDIRPFVRDMATEILALRPRVAELEHAEENNRLRVRVAQLEAVLREARPYVSMFSRSLDRAFDKLVPQDFMGRIDAILAQTAESEAMRCSLCNAIGTNSCGLASCPLPPLPPVTGGAQAGDILGDGGLVDSKVCEGGKQ